MITHIPPGVMEERGSPRWFAPEFNEKLVDILTSYGDVILAVYSAHEHVDAFRMIYNAGKHLRKQSTTSAAAGTCRV